MRVLFLFRLFYMKIYFIKSELFKISNYLNLILKTVILYNILIIFKKLTY